MFGSDILETAIGLAAVYALLSIVCSAARETLEAVLKSRARNLEQGITELVGAEMAKKIYEHPMVFGQFREKGYIPPQKDGVTARLRRRHSLPSYIPARHFAIAVYDLTRPGAPSREASPDATGRAKGAAPETEKRAVEANADTNVRRIVPLAIDAAYSGAEGALAEIEGWFNGAMDRVSGWYRRRTQWILLLLATVFTVAMNVNTLQIADHLYRHRAEREALIARLEPGAPNAPDTTQAQAALLDLGLPLGWPAEVGEPDGISRRKFVWRSLVGWLLTIFAVSLGAPFWFDVLNRLMVIRSTVKPHEKSPEEGSEDRLSRTGPRRPSSGGSSWEPLPLAYGSVPASANDPGPEREGPEGELQAGVR